MHARLAVTGSPRRNLLGTGRLARGSGVRFTLPSVPGSHHSQLACLPVKLLSPSSPWQFKINRTHLYPNIARTKSQAFCNALKRCSSKAPPTFTARSAYLSKQCSVSRWAGITSLAKFSKLLWCVKNSIWVFSASLARIRSVLAAL